MSDNVKERLVTQEDLEKLNKVIEQTATKQTIVSTDLLLRVTVLENLLIDKGVFTEEEFQKNLSTVTDQLKEVLLVALKEGGHDKN